MTTEPLSQNVNPHAKEERVVALRVARLFEPGECIELDYGNHQPSLCRVVESLCGGWAVKVVPWVEPDSAG